MLFVTFLPYLADYYVLQPNISFREYYSQYVIDRYYAFETIIITLFVLSIVFFSEKVWFSMSVAAVVLFILAHATSIKYAARNEFLRISDIKLIDAARLAVQYLNFKLCFKQIWVICFVLFLCISVFAAERCCKRYSLSIKYIWRTSKSFQRFRIFAGCTFFTIMICYGNYFIGNEYSKEFIDKADTIGMENDRYVLYVFLKNDSMANINMKSIEESYRFFKEISLAHTCGKSVENIRCPNIIVIMNESWWNTDNIWSDNIKFSLDPMKPYKKLAEESSCGYVFSNVFGGGTISSEMEFLTGLNTKYFLSDTSIYLEMRKRKMPSIVEYFNELQYDTIAVHPYYGEFYDRNTIYANLGFDKIIFEEDMQYTEIYSRYISDESLVKQIIKEYEESKNDQKFIFAVSVANHIKVLDYKQDFVKDYMYPVSVTLDKESLSEDDAIDLVNYINGIYLANESLMQLVSYFKSIDEPIVILMYGDHAPSFSKDALELMGLNSTDVEIQKCLYSVPVLMWSNFDAQQIEFSGENINYLPQMLIRYAGLPETDMVQILEYEQSVLQANTRKIVQDNYGQWIEKYNEKQIEAVRHFKVIDYDILFGNSSQRDALWKPYDIGK